MGRACGFVSAAGKEAQAGSLLNLWKVVIGRMLEVVRPLGGTVVAENRTRALTYAEQGGTQAEAYLQDRGLPAGMADRAGIGLVGKPLDGDERFKGWLSIPYLDADGHCVGVRFRNLQPDGDPRYSMRAGDHTVLYNMQALDSFDEEIHLCEGEIDTLSLASCGLQAVGVPGVNNWRPWFARLLDCRRLYVWGDGDSAGDGLFETVCEMVSDCVRVHVPRGMDVNSVLLERGRKGVLGLVPKD